MQNIRCLLVAGLLWGVALDALAEEAIDLSSPRPLIRKVLENYRGTPDKDGVLARYRIEMPDYEAGIVFLQDDLYNRSGNRFWGRTFTPEAWTPYPKGWGQLMVLKLKSGAYMAFLPLANDVAMSWLTFGEDGEVMLKAGHWGTEAVNGDVPLYTYVLSSNPYQAAYKAWDSGLSIIPEDVRGRFRGDKEYPQEFSKLGWCSWEAYHRDVSEELLLGILRDYKQSGIPVKYMVIDGGHWSFEKGAGPKADIFPEGYANLAAALDGEPFRWLGFHYQSLAWKDGVLPPPDNDLGDFNQYMVTLPGKTGSFIAPADSLESMTKWMEYLSSFRPRWGSIMKIDFLKDPLLFYAAELTNTEKQANPVRAAARYKIAMEEVLRKQGVALMNCNGNNYPMPFFARYSNSSRCSEDYHKNRLDSAISHTYNSYSTILDLGHLYWGDHDMFHSSDQFAGELMAVCKAMSGGPIYFSDKPEDVVKENLTPLCYDDGSLPRPLAPGIMSEDSLFYSDRDTDALFKAFAPLHNRTVTIHIMHLGAEEGVRKAAITTKDYENGSSMMQPYAGPLKMPAEGLILYDVLEGTGMKFGGAHEVELDKPLQHKLYQLSPIEDGWALIGRVDKYLSGATASAFNATKKALEFRLYESGPFVIYSAGGAPKAQGVQFTPLGNDLYRGDMPHGPSLPMHIVR